MSHVPLQSAVNARLALISMEAHNEVQPKNVRYILVTELGMGGTLFKVLQCQNVPYIVVTEPGMFGILLRA